MNITKIYEFSIILYYAFIAPNCIVPTVFKIFCNQFEKLNIRIEP